MGLLTNGGQAHPLIDMSGNNEIAAPAIAPHLESASKDLFASWPSFGTTDEGGVTSDANGGSTLVDDASTDAMPVIDIVATPTPVEDFFTHTVAEPTVLEPTGWRKMVRVASFGGITPAPSARQVTNARRHAAFLRPLATCERVAVASAKGGVGKTTVTLLTGMALALNRQDKILAIDANPDAGSLGWRIPRETTATVQDLLEDIESIERYGDVRTFTSQSRTRLEVIASRYDPRSSDSLSAYDYRRLMGVLGRYYSVMLMDLGTGLVDDGTQGILSQADQVIVVTHPAVDAARIADYTLDFIQQRSPRRAHDAIVVINSVRKETPIDVAALERHFHQRVRRVVTLPFDAHLSTGAIPIWDKLDSATKEGYLLVAEAVSAGCPTPWMREQ